MNAAQHDHLVAIRDALARARAADEQLRGAVAEATVWVSIALTDDNNDNTEGEAP